MLHPPPCIWVPPHNQSLQPLYLHYDTMLHTEITSQIYRRVGGVAFLPRRLRGPPPLSPMHALPWHLVVTPAPAGLNMQGSGHRPWYQSLTTGCQKSGVAHHPSWTPTPVIISVGQLLALSPLALPSWWGPPLPILLPPCVHPPWLIFLFLCLLIIFLQGGIIGPAQEVAGPELCDTVRLLGDVWHKIHQCSSCPLLCPAEVIGNPAGGDPLHLVPGGIIHQDASFEDEAPHINRPLLHR